MKGETIDIHKTQSRLNAIEKKIASDKNILPVNKNYIADFLDEQKAKGLRPTTLTKDMYSIWFVGCNLKKDFKQCDKADIIKVCGVIEKQNWSEKTKRNHTVIIKKFWKWLEGIEEKKVYPKIVSWINTNEKIKNKKLPEELLSEEDIEKMAQASDSPRDRAFLLLAYESGARIGELLNIKIKHIVFNEYGAFVMLNGKTGMRRVPIVMSAPALATFIDLHPFKDNPESYMFLTSYNAMSEGAKGRYVPLTYAGSSKILKTLAKKAGIKKRVFPHLLRHSSATRSAKFMTEAQMKVYFGWTNSSNMPSIYVHLSSRDIEDAVRKMNKLPITEESMTKATIKICSRCKVKNSFGSKFCNACGYPLDLKTAIEIEEKRKAWDDKMALLVKDPEVQKILIRKLGKMKIEE